MKVLKEGVWPNPKYQPHNWWNEMYVNCDHCGCCGDLENDEDLIKVGDGVFQVRCPTFGCPGMMDVYQTDRATYPRDASSAFYPVISTITHDGRVIGPGYDDATDNPCASKLRETIDARMKATGEDRRTAAHNHFEQQENHGATILPD